MTTELRVFGREGRSGAEVVEVEVAGLVEVIVVVEAAGLLVDGAKAFPEVVSYQQSEAIAMKRVIGDGDAEATSHNHSQDKETHQLQHLLSPTV